MEELWHYAEDGVSRGPVARSEIEAMIRQAALQPDTLVWREGMADWKEARDFFTFPHASAAPPLPRQATTGPDGLYIGAPARGFGEAISVCFSKYVTFSGRASRSEYWYFVLFTILAAFALGLVDGVLGTGTSDGGLLSGLFSLVTLLPSLAVAFRRLHDVGRSGWWIGAGIIGLAAGGALIASVAIAGNGIALAAVFGIAALAWAIMIFVFAVTRGEAGPNAYG